MRAKIAREHGRTGNLDIYTGKLMESPSEEHVIHDFLGGALHSNLLDRKTNSDFGSGIDAKLYEQFRSVLLRLDLRSSTKKNESPRPRIVVPANDARRWALRPNFDLQLVSRQVHIFSAHLSEKNEVTLSLAMEGGQDFDSAAAADAVYKSLLRRDDLPEVWKQSARKNEMSVRKQLEVQLRANLTTEQALLDIVMHIMIDESVLQAIVKIACNFFAAHHREKFCGPGFDAVKAYVLSAEGDPPVRFHYPPPEEVTGITHAVAFDIHNDGRVMAVVTLFGHLCYRVFLGQIKPGEVRLSKLMYLVNQPEQTSRYAVPKRNIGVFADGESIDDSISQYAKGQQIGLLVGIELAGMKRKLAESPVSEWGRIRSETVERVREMLRTL